MPTLRLTHWLIRSVGYEALLVVARRNVHGKVVEAHIHERAGRESAARIAFDEAAAIAREHGMQALLERRAPRV